MTPLASLDLLATGAIVAAAGFFLVRRAIRALRGGPAGACSCPGATGSCGRGDRGADEWRRAADRAIARVNRSPAGPAR